jgi:uncharacterized protein YggE
MKTRIAAVALMAFASLTQAAELPAYPFIHANGRAEISMPADEATLDFEIIASDLNHEAAAGVVQARAGEIRTLAAAVGIPEADVDIANPRVDLRKDATAYDVKVTVRIVVRDVSIWAALVQPILGMANVDGLTTDFDSSKRADMEAQLLAEAVKDAQRRAQALATGAGKRLGAVAGISHDPLKNLSTALGFVEADFRYTGGRGPDRSPKPASEYLIVQGIKLQQSVDVVYRIR